MRLSSTVNSLRIMASTFITSCSLNSRIRRGSGAAPGGPAGIAIPAAGVVARRYDENIAAFLGQLDGAEVCTDHRFKTRSEAVQCHDEWRLAILADFRGDEQAVWKFLAGVLEQIRADLHARIDRSELGAEIRLRRARRGLLRARLRCRDDQEDACQSSDQSRLRKSWRSHGSSLVRSVRQFQRTGRRTMWPTAVLDAGTW